MGEWIEDLATACGQDPLTEQDTEDILRIAREVAHHTERKLTPLATYLLGMRVADGIAGGKPRTAAMAEGIRVVEGLLPAPSEDQ